MGLYYNGKKVRNLYFNGKCITRLALGKEMTRLVEGDDFIRAEWLKGDGTAFIRTDKSINIGDEVDCSIIPINDIPAELNWRFVYGNEGGDNPYTFMCVIFSSNSMRFRHKRAFTSYISNKIYSIKHSISNVFVNGTELTYESEANYTESSRTLMLFNSSNSTTNYVFSGYIGNFRLTNKLSLTPVRLLRPIPATLDANGIARNADECGMFDAVSGKFYGNVASSGKFTVEPSLVEGVDYERHKWLVGDGSAYIKIKGYTRNEYWTIRTKCRVRGAGAINQYSQIYGATYYNNIYGAWSLFSYPNVTAILMRSSSASSYSDISFNYNYNDVISITDEHNSITINNITKSTIADRVYFDNDEFWLFSIYDNRYIMSNPTSRIADADISNFTITGNGTTVLDLVPVRLLRPLPSYLDANGKARHQFECGMLDLKTMKFYGNVNTSGNFTVSDN